MPRRLRQVRIEAHGDVMRRRLGARPFEMHVLAHDELKYARKRGFHGRDIHFAVAHSGVAVAHLEQRAFGVHRDEQRGSRHQIFVIEIAGVNPRRTAIDFPGGFRRRDAHASEKRRERQIDSGAEVADISLPVERDDFAFYRCGNTSARNPARPMLL